MSSRRPASVFLFLFTKCFRCLLSPSLPLCMLLIFSSLPVSLLHYLAFPCRPHSQFSCLPFVVFAVFSLSLSSSLHGLSSRSDTFICLSSVFQLCALLCLAGHITLSVFCHPPSAFLCLRSSLPGLSSRSQTFLSFPSSHYTSLHSPPHHRVSLRPLSISCHLCRALSPSPPLGTVCLLVLRFFFSSVSPLRLCLLTLISKSLSSFLVCHLSSLSSSS